MAQTSRKSASTASLVGGERGPRRWLREPEGRIDGGQMERAIAERGRELGVRALRRRGCRPHLREAVGGSIPLRIAHISPSTSTPPSARTRAIRTRGTSSTSSSPPASGSDGPGVDESADVLRARCQPPARAAQPSASEWAAPADRSRETIVVPPSCRPRTAHEPGWSVPKPVQVPFATARSECATTSARAYTRCDGLAPQTSAVAIQFGSVIDCDRGLTGPADPQVQPAWTWLI